MCLSSQEENGLKSVMNSSRKVACGTEVRLTQGIPWRAQASKQSNSSASTIFKTDVCLSDKVSSNMLLSSGKYGGGRQWSAAGQTTSGVGRDMVQVQRLAREESLKKTHNWGDPLLRETCPTHLRSTAGLTPAVQKPPSTQGITLKQDSLSLRASP